LIGKYHASGDIRDTHILKSKFRFIEDSIVQEPDVNDRLLSHCMKEHISNDQILDVDHIRGVGDMNVKDWPREIKVGESIVEDERSIERDHVD
jgi:hypothetical protein